jgi:hypothetical protein
MFLSGKVLCFFPERVHQRIKTLLIHNINKLGPGQGRLADTVYPGVENAPSLR